MGVFHVFKIVQMAPNRVTGGDKIFTKGNTESGDE